MWICTSLKRLVFHGLRPQHELSGLNIIGKFSPRFFSGGRNAVPRFARARICGLGRKTARVTNARPCPAPCPPLFRSSRCASQRARAVFASPLACPSLSVHLEKNHLRTGRNGRLDLRVYSQQLPVFGRGRPGGFNLDQPLGQGIPDEESPQVAAGTPGENIRGAGRGERKPTFPFHRA